MLWEFVKQDKILTISIIVIGILWMVVFMRNLWIIKRSTGKFERTYEQILTAEEFKVKGKYDQ